MNAEDVMNPAVVTVRPETPLDDAALLMTRHHVNTLPVTDGDRRLLGVLTEGDLFRALALRLGIGLSPTARIAQTQLPHRVADVARADAPRLDHAAELSHCLTVMARHSSSGLPVVDAARVVGIIGRREAIQALALVDADQVRRRASQGQIPAPDAEQVPA